MKELTDFEITNKWPPQHPDRIQLYSLPTPNGIKVSAMGLIAPSYDDPAAPSTSSATSRSLANSTAARMPSSRVPAFKSAPATTSSWKQRLTTKLSRGQG